MKKEIYLIDGSSFLYRFFFAIKGLSKNGYPTGAIFGFARMLLEINKDNPEYIAVLFDTKAKTFREDILDSYKQNRPKMPDELVLQIEPIKELIRYFGIEIIEKDGYEADDLIATIAEKLKNDFKIFVVANDKDLFQIVEDENVVVYDPVKKIYYNEEAVFEKLGVYPNQVADYLALVGDSIDNIPGVKYIGPKTAALLLREYENLDGILQNLDKLKPKIKEAIEKDGNLKLYQSLTTIDRNAPIDFSLNMLRKKEANQNKAVDMFLKFGFKTLVSEIGLKEEKNQEPYNVDKPVLFMENNTCFVLKNGEVNKIEPKTIDYETVVYDYKELLWKGFEFKYLPFDIKLACYLLKSDSEGSIDSCFENIDDSVYYKINKETNKANKLALAYRSIEDKISEYGIGDLLFKMEEPLSYLLYKMEKAGLKVDIDYLYKFKNELINKQETIKKEIYALSGEEFNINSTKELQRILFEKLKIKPIKKTKTGYSTDFDTLTQLAKKYDIANLLIKYREIAKVVSTYIVPFIEKADKNGRIHTTFNQTLTSTGRLSSSNPNLQNLPAREDEIHSGIRRSVIAENGYKLVCSDYSQIELRVLAHLSKDATLIETFKNGGDIHTQTAVKLFGVHPTMVDHNLRRMAKVINFGILYGMGYVSLAKTLNIQNSKAKEIIERYFERFESVKLFIDKTIDEVIKKGYVETYFKRRRYFYNINSSNQRLSSFEKRAAVNAVIQGTAADIIKMAMVELDKELSGLDVKIILQVHDELLVETKEDIVEEVEVITKKVMENVVQFDIPISVNIKSAHNWLEAK